MRRRRAAGVLVAIVAIVAVASSRSPESSSSAVPTATATASATAPTAPTAPPVGHASGDFREALGESAGTVPDGTTVFDDAVPGVANLDPALLDALRRAASDADTRFVVESGWRSEAYQSELLREATVKYGSEQEASRWVATPETSAHVSGDAVDIGPAAAAAWLAEHGAAYGLCQTYDNEPWHFELRPDAAAHGCPAKYPDPTFDPRMQQ